MSISVIDAQNKDLEVRSFTFTDGRVFYEIMDFFTVLIMYRGMPRYAKVQFEVPKSALLLSAVNTLEAYKFCTEYMQELVKDIEILPPQQIDGNKIRLLVGFD